MTSVEQKIWTTVLEMEVLNITRLLIEVNRDSRFIAQMYFYGGTMSASICVDFLPGGYNTVNLMRQKIETSARDFLNEEAFIKAKLDIEAVKRRLIECLHGTVNLEPHKRSETPEIMM